MTAAAKLRPAGDAVEPGDAPQLPFGPGAAPPADLAAQSRAAAGGAPAAAPLSGSGSSPDVARAGLLRLATMPPARDFPPARWADTVAACQYVGAEWLARAIELGWSLPDVFGAHPVKPYAAVHVAGLALCLGPRGRITALTAESATIGGVTFRRRCAPGGARVLIWDLTS